MRAANPLRVATLKHDHRPVHAAAMARSADPFPQYAGDDEDDDDEDDDFGDEDEDDEDDERDWDEEDEPETWQVRPHFR